MTRNELLALACKTAPEIAIAVRNNRPREVYTLQNFVSDQLDDVDPSWTGTAVDRQERRDFRDRLVAIVSMNLRGEA